MTSRNRVVVRAPRRPMSWVLSTAGSTPIAAGAVAAVDLLASRTDFQRTDVTVTRIRGELALTPQSDVDDTYQWFAGITVVNKQAAGVGVTALPDPETENADWLWFDGGHIFPAFYADSAGVERVLALPRYISIDSKSQRKMHEENKSLQLIIKNDAASSPLEFMFVTRTLLKR